MGSEIIYVCHSINNKNVREGELKILEKHENELYFEFGENAMNVKKRYYNDVETLNKDFEALLRLKEEEDSYNKSTKAEENLEEKDKKEYKRLGKNKEDLF